MTKYIVQGGRPLFGEVEISGAKNAAVAIIPAALLVDGVCRIENIPQISDVTMSLKILEQLGANIRSINPHVVEIDCRHIRSTRTSYELSRKIRASYYLIVGFGGTYGHLYTAMEEMRKHGHKTALAHFEFINPLPANTAEVLKRYPKVVVAEQNLGQFAAYLRAKVDGFVPYTFNQVKGQPFVVSELVENFEDLLK